MAQQFSTADFTRQDESDDGNFYTQPRMVVHIDEYAIAAVTDVIRRRVPTGARVLDLMSSYRSHLPSEVQYQEVVGLGMNGEEMRANEQLNDFVVHNLNKNPQLPFEDTSFDAVLNTVSIQYLVHPVEVMREVARVLRPGGVSIITFSNRMFPTKAVRIWYSGDDESHIQLVHRYYQLAGGYTRVIVERHEDKSTLSWFNRGHDPLFAVIGVRSAE
ncbi:MAG: class I SAM-dependent methyltransferase [Ktedonobacteraceae bacterium]